MDGGSVGASDGDVFAVAAVVLGPGQADAVEHRRLGAVAAQLVQPDGSVAGTERVLFQHVRRSFVAHHAAQHLPVERMLSEVITSYGLKALHSEFVIVDSHDFLFRFKISSPVFRNADAIRK